jgi:2-haloacid dehalogenase
MSKISPEKLAIVFDLGGVLIDWNPNYLFLPMFDGDQASVDALLNQVCTPEWNAKQDAGRSLAEAVEERVAKFPEYAAYIEAYYQRWEEMIGGAISGTVEILSNLREKGFPLFALSNWSAETYPKAVRMFEFLNWFDDVIISGREKLVKPDPAIYRLLLQRINREAENCLFIDDTAHNIHAAQRLGFQTVHFTSPEQLLTVLQERGVV